MAAAISLKQSKIPSALLKRTGHLAGNAALSYFSDAEVAPVMTSTIEEAASTISGLNSKLKTTTQSITSQVRSMRKQFGMRSVFNWFMGSEDSFSNDYGEESNLTFDTSTDDAESKHDAQISELREVTNNVSKTVIESNRHLLEGQTNLTANIVDSVTKQTSVISAGFDNTNKLLKDILEVLTKNTATMIELESKRENPVEAFGNGRFNLNNYKKLLSKNFQGSDLGMLSVIGTLMSKDNIKTFLTAENLTSVLFKNVLNKAAPNFKKNVKALDDAVNDIIMNSLIRIGENKNNPLAQIFGIDASRKSFSKNSRSSIELKPVPFDSVTKESITQAIPGYLRKILVQLGGEDVIYDPRTRQFRKQSSIKREFMGHTASTGNLYSVNSRLQKAFGSDDMGNMMFDLMLADLGSKQGSGAARTQIQKFANPAEFYSYFLSLYNPQNKRERKYISKTANRLSSNKQLLMDLSNAVAMNNVNRNSEVAAYLREADAYGIDISKLKSSRDKELQHILKEYGAAGSTVKATGKPIVSGTEYTNMALYEILRTLDRGINVAQVSGPFKQIYKGKVGKIASPAAYRPKDITPSNKTGKKTKSNLVTGSGENELTDENIDSQDRFSKWSHRKGGELMGALFTGDPDQVRSVMQGAGADISTAIGEAFSQKLVPMVDYAKDYFKDAFAEPKNKVKEWLESVGSYFNFGDGEDGKKKKGILGASVGALAGAGILGGPLGLMMGAMAGNAIELGEIGGMTKGIFKKAVDTIIDPIRYQFEKTANTIGNVLKNKVLGPISDIGVAIKEHVTNIADKTFGRVFKFIGNVLMAPFRLITKVAKLPFQIVGGVTRTAARLTGGVAGAALGGVANILANGTHTEIDPVTGEKTVMTTRDYLDERREGRKRDYDLHKDFGKYKDWKGKQDERRAKFAETHKLVDYSGDPDGDVGTHGLLSKIIDILQGKSGKGGKTVIDGKTGKVMSAEEAAQAKANEAENEDQDKESANAIVSAGAAIVGSDGSINKEEARNFLGVVKESIKEKVSKNSMVQKLNGLLGIQKDKSDNNEKKEKNIFEKLFDLIGGSGGIISTIKNLLPIAGIVAGISLLAKHGSDIMAGIYKVGTVVGGAITTIKDRLGSVIRYLFGGPNSDDDPNTSNDPVTNAANAALALTGNKVTHFTDIPLGNVYYKDNTAGGDLIKNANVSRDAKHLLLTRNFINSAYQTAGQGYSGMTHFAGANIARNFAKTGVVAGLSSVAGYGVGKAVYKFTGNEQWAQYGQAIGTTLTATAMTKNMVKAGIAGKSTIVDKIVDLLGKGFNFLAQHLKSVKALQGVLTKITSFLDDIFSKTVGKITNAIAAKIEAALTKIAGKEVLGNAAAVATAGLSVAAGAAIGALRGAFSAEALFRVGPDQADGLMKTVSTIMEGLLSAFEWAPGGVGFFVSIIRLLDDLVIKGILGMSFEQKLAEVIYVALGGSESELRRKQKGLTESREAYEQKYGTTISDQAYSDLVNSNGLLDRVWNGKAVTNRDGTINLEATFDEAGNRRNAGLKGAMFGNRTYATDANGNVLRDAAGSAITLKDKYGRDIKDQTKFGDKLGNLAGNVIRFFTGGNVYETDENGVQKLDENGNPIIKEIEDNIFGKAKDFFAGVIDDRKKISKMMFDGDVNGIIDTFIHNDSPGIFSPLRVLLNVPGIIPEIMIGGVVHIGKSIADGIKTGIDKAKNGITVLTENQRILDEAVQKGDIEKVWGAELKVDADNPVGPVTQAIFGIDKFFSAIMALIYKVGNKVSDFVNGVKDKLNGAKEWLEDKGNNVGNWVSNGVQTAGNWVSNGVQAAGDWWNGLWSGGVGGPLTKSAAVSSGFGQRSYPYQGMHSGVDLVPMDGSGQSDVQSQVYGTVSYVRNNVSNSDHAKYGSNGWKYNGTNAGGNMVWIDTPDGRRIKNMHLKAGSIPSNLKRGSRVSIGSKIGEIGSTGWSTGNHLHYQVEKNGIPIDPTGGVGGGYATYNPGGNYTYNYIPQAYKENATNSWLVENSLMNNRFGQTRQSSGPSYYVPEQYKQYSSLFSTHAWNNQTYKSKGSTAGMPSELLKYINRYAKGSTAGMPEEARRFAEENGWLEPENIHYTTDDGDSYSGESYFSDSNYDTTSTEEDTRGPFAQFIDALGQIGTGILNYITGGLFSSSSSSSSSSGSTLSTGEAGARVVEVALGEIGVVEDPPHSNSVKYNREFYGNDTRLAWCAVFVWWCFNKAGFPLKYKQAAVSSLYECYKRNYPDNIISPDQEVLPGDIFINKSLHHTGIVVKDNGDGTFTSIEGNTSAKDVNSTNGGCVASHPNKKKSTMVAFIRPPEIAVASSSLAGIGNVQGISDLWKYFKGLGYPDAAIAGILGPWSKESSGKSRRIEGDYLGEFKNYGGYNMINDKNAMTKWTNYLFSNPYKGKGYNRSAYNASGSAYPGLGYAQWTGPRAKALLEFARANNMDWSSATTQLAFMERELKNGYQSTYNNLMKATDPETASDIFAKGYEGAKREDMLAERRAAARSIYSKYATGGGDENLYVPFMYNSVGGVPSSVNKSYINNISRRSKNKATQSSYSQNLRNTYRVINAAGNTPSINNVSINGTDLTGVIQMMTQVVAVLNNIAVNTATSSDYLEELNDKDFVDTEVRNALTNLGKVNKTKKSQVRNASSKSNAKMVYNMATP